MNFLIVSAVSPTSLSHLNEYFSKIFLENCMANYSVPLVYMADRPISVQKICGNCCSKKKKKKSMSIFIFARETLRMYVCCFFTVYKIITKQL